jgi:FecR protein
MRKGIRISFVALLLLALAPFLGLTVDAQYLISSKAGFVNRVEGKVYILRQGSQDVERESASLGKQMQDGDKLSTEMGSKAEVLLNPGSYLRIDENTEVRAVDTSLSQTRFELIEGSVIIEAGEIDKKLPLEIATPHGMFFITKNGLHRIDARGETTSVAVRQGEIYLGTREQVMTKKAFKTGRGKVLTLNGTSVPMVAKLNKDAIDDFDTWSFDRAETLMAANNNALSRSNNARSLASGWLYNPLFSCYTFIPRSWMYWSPYGFGFSNAYDNCYGCYSGFNGYGYRRPYPGSSNRGHRGTLPPRAIAGTDCNIIRRHIESSAWSASQNPGSMIRGGRGSYGSGRSASSPSSSSPSRSNPSSPGRMSSPGSSRGGSYGRPASPRMPSRRN